MAEETSQKENLSTYLDGDHVIIGDPVEASRIYNKGYFGTPQSGGALKLDLMESVFLMEVGKIAKVSHNGRRMPKERVIRLAYEKIVNFEIKYLVYRDMRLRGYVVKPGTPPLDFRVLPRGGSPGKTPSKYWVSAISERWMFKVQDILKEIDSAKRVRKTLLLAVVDEESDLTYYQVRMVKPKGHIGRADVQTKGHALFLGDRVLMVDPLEAEIIHGAEFFGKIIDNTLQLSLLETRYLMEREMIDVRSAETGRKMSIKRFTQDAKKAQPDFDLRYPVYKDLKEKGILVKTGFKYGCHFRGYEGDPDHNHARYLIHSIPEDYSSLWADISRVVRLAHGVKKQILLGVQSDAPLYVNLKRVRP